MKKNKIGMTKGDKVFTAIIYILCGILLLLILYPLYFILIASISDPDAIARGEVYLHPVNMSLEAYQVVFENSMVWTGYRNTILYTVTGTLLSLVVTLPAAYALGRKDFPIRKGLILFFLFAMYFHGGMIATYLVVRKLGLLDTVLAMILPGCVNIYHMIVAKTFFENNIPRELQEAAALDGCSDFRFFLRIVLPLSKAIIAVIGLYTAVILWNGYMNALMYIKSSELQPLQVVLRNILLVNDSTPQGMGEAAQRRAEMLKYSLIVVSTLPIMCAYPFVQKYFAKGVMIGSVKG